MLAHHWMVGGEFKRNVNGMVEPIYTTHHPYVLLGQDLMEDVARLMRVFNAELVSLRISVNHSRIQADANHIHNLSSIYKEWPHMLGIAFPVGLVPFWDSHMLMECVQFTTLHLTEFSADELARNPMSELLHAVHVDSDLTFFMIFVMVNNPESGLPIATFWMLKFTVFLGKVMPCKNLPLQIQFGMDSHSWWTISSNDTCWYPAKSLVCTWPCATSAAAM